MSNNVFLDLDEVRSVARARSIESFEYFAHYVLGLRSQVPNAEELAQRALRGESVSFGLKNFDSALSLWLQVLSVHDVQDVQSTLCSNEVFSWLFPEHARRAA